MKSRDRDFDKEIPERETLECEGYVCFSYRNTILGTPLTPALTSQLIRFSTPKRPFGAPNISPPFFRK